MASSSRRAPTGSPRRTGRWLLPAAVVLLAPLLLIIANVLAFGATMGISALLFNHVFGFPASDPSTMLIGFVLLVALGIDYSIFLTTRVREESIRQGTHPGILKGLSVTAG
jgi:RND superfamily putative drug exporter